jgi:hypothetical protein
LQRYSLPNLSGCRSALTTSSTLTKSQRLSYLQALAYSYFTCHMSTPSRPPGSFCGILKYLTFLSNAHLLLLMQRYCSVLDPFPLMLLYLLFAMPRRISMIFFPTKAYSDCLHFLLVCLDPHFSFPLDDPLSHAFLFFITIL